MLSHKLKPIGFIFSGLLTLGFFLPTEAAVHKCTDKNGRTYYQDKACQDLIAERLTGGLAKISSDEERAFLWKAVGEKGTLYLLGSLHLGTQSLYPLPQAVMDAFSASDVVVVEVDLRDDSEKELTDALKGRGHYADKGNLEEHVKPVTWNKTVEMAKKLGINEEVLRPLKPWLAALILAAESQKQAGFSADFGVDHTFIKESQGKKPVMEMENLEEQVQMLEALPDLEQEQMLLQTLRDLGRAADLYKNITDAWKHGDAEAMDLVVRQGFGSGQTSDKLFKDFYSDPNERMVNRLKEMAGDGRTYFVVVGAGHLGGENGMLKLLVDKGFKITQP